MDLEVSGSLGIRVKASGWLTESRAKLDNGWRRLRVTRQNVTAPPVPAARAKRFLATRCEGSGSSGAPQTRGFIDQSRQRMATAQAVYHGFPRLSPNPTLSSWGSHFLVVGGERPNAILARPSNHSPTKGISAQLFAWSPTTLGCRSHHFFLGETLLSLSHLFQVKKTLFRKSRTYTANNSFPFIPLRRSPIDQAIIDHTPRSANPPDPCPETSYIMALNLRNTTRAFGSLKVS